MNADRETCTHRRTAVQVGGIPPPHYGKRTCTDCGRFLGWVRAPPTPERLEELARE